MPAPLASASSLSQLDRQLRQKPARFISSMFWTSVRERRCSTRRRNTAASSSVLVLSSVVMAMISLLKQEFDIKWHLSQILPYRSAKTARETGSGRPLTEKVPEPLTAPVGSRNH